MSNTEPEGFTLRPAALDDASYTCFSIVGGEACLYPLTAYCPFSSINPLNLALLSSCSSGV
jgi:hypothetical protein